MENLSYYYIDTIFYDSQINRMQMYKIMFTSAFHAATFEFRFNDLYLILTLQHKHKKFGFENNFLSLLLIHFAFSLNVSFQKAYRSIYF